MADRKIIKTEKTVDKIITIKVKTILIIQTPHKYHCMLAAAFIIYEPLVKNKYQVKNTLCINILTNKN